MDKRPAGDQQGPPNKRQRNGNTPEICVFCGASVASVRIAVFILLDVLLASVM